MANMAGPSEKHFYHFADSAGLKGIQEDGKINASPEGGKDAQHGAGVYFASKSPRVYSKTSIAKNNWGNQHGHHFVNNGRVDYALKVTPNDPSLMICHEIGGRRIHRFNKDGFVAGVDGPMEALKVGSQKQVVSLGTVQTPTSAPQDKPV